MKLKTFDESGETMVETLVSILVSTLALLLLGTAITTSLNLIVATKDNLNRLYANESNLVNLVVSSDGAVMSDGTIKSSVPLRVGSDAIDVRSYTITSDGVAHYEVRLP